MRHGTQPRPCAAALAVAVAALGLTGCGQSKEQWADFVASVDAVPGVEVVYSGASTPLPFSVSGSIDVRMAAQPEIWAEFLEVACSTPAGASVGWGIELFRDDGGLTARTLGACPSFEEDLQRIAVTVEEAAPGCVLDYNENSQGELVYLAGNSECDRQWPALLPALAKRLTAFDRFSVSSESLEGALLLEEAPQLARLLTALKTYQVTRVVAGDVLVLETERTDESGAISSLVREVGPPSWAELDVVVDAPGGSEVDASASVEAVALADRLQERFPLITDVKVRFGSVALIAPDPSALGAIIEAGPSLDPGDVPVQLTMVWSEDHPAFASDVGGFVLTEDSPYPLFWQQYEQLARLDDVRGVEFGGSYLDVAIEDILDQESDGFHEVRELVEQFDETEQYEWYSIGKHYVERE